LVDRSYIKRVTFLGGEPLYYKNLDGILELCKDIKLTNKNKMIWIYSGYKFEDILSNICDDMLKRQQILRLCDVMVDGQFIDGLKDMNLQFRGSSNQRLINLKESLEKGKVVLWKE
jgi:anaerobic ribonucleoside-triphosphate reductase activating protein